MLYSVREGFDYKSYKTVQSISYKKEKGKSITLYFWLRESDVTVKPPKTGSNLQNLLLLYVVSFNSVSIITVNVQFTNQLLPSN